MTNEKRLIDANGLVADLEVLAKYEDDFSQSVILGVVHTVRNRPTVDAVEVVHGRWENVRILLDDGARLRVGDCSRCESTHKLFNYCPNCGADMRERKDND